MVWIFKEFYAVTQEKTAAEGVPLIHVKWFEQVLFDALPFRSDSYGKSVFL